MSRRMRLSSGVGSVAAVSSASRMVFEKDSAGGGDAGAGGEEGVAEDAEDPGLEVGAGLKGVEGAKSFGEGLLHEVFCLCLIACEPEGVVVERGEERERELFEVCAARGRHHVIKCLALNGATELDRHAEQSFTSEHHYP